MLMMASASTAILTLYLVRVLSPQSYGVFSLAVAIGTLLVVPSDLGISLSASRFIAERRGDRAGVAGFLGDALRLKLVVLITVCMTLVAAAGPIAEAYDAPALTWPLRGAALALFGQSIMFLYREAFVGLGRVSLTMRVVFSASAIETTATIALVAFGAGATGAAFGRAAGFMAGGAIALFQARRIVGPHGRRPPAQASGGTRLIAGYAAPLFLVETAFSVFEQVDALVIGAVLGTGSVGLFQAPMRLAMFLHYPGEALALGMAPRLAWRDQAGLSAASFETALRYLIRFQAWLLAPIVVWAGPIVNLLLGDDYGGSIPVLRALAPAVFLLGIAPLVSRAVNYLGESRRRVPIAIAAPLVNVAVDLALIPRMGIVGGAIGTGLGLAVYVLGHLWICREVMGLAVWPLARTSLRSVAAAGAMAAVLAVSGTSGLSAAGWVFGLAGGTFVFCALLLATGEVSRAELVALRQRLLHRLRAFSRPRRD